MSALDKAMAGIDRLCDCYKNYDRCTVSVRGGDVDRDMFWVMACEDCAPLRKAAIAKEFGDDVRVVRMPGKTPKACDQQLTIFEVAQ